MIKHKKMMKTKFALIFIALFSLVAPNVYSQSYGKTIACEDAALGSFKSNLDFCSSSNKDFNSFIRCRIDAWKTYGNSTCMNSIRAGAANQVFIQQQMLNVEQDFDNKRISKSKEEEQYRKLINLYKEQYQLILRDMEREFDELHENQVAKRNYQFISFAINALGGTQQSQKSPSVTTYLLNNRVISCTTVGNVVSCN